MSSLTPKQIVTELDRYIVGQDKAKRAVAISLRNRWRRQMVAPEMKDDIYPKNIILIGPTGVGKTEIARRLAKLAGAPFFKVEASKFTEVGYVGRDVESMIRDLVDIAVNMVKIEKSRELGAIAEKNTTEKLLDLLVGPAGGAKSRAPKSAGADSVAEEDAVSKTRDKFRLMLEAGKLEDREIELDTPQRSFPVIEVFSPQGMEELGVNFQEMFSGLMPKKTKRRKMKIRDARKYLAGEELSRLINMDDVIADALERTQESGIVFIDEIDKVVGGDNRTGPDVSREGVQRDILPIVEGSAVMTKYGMVHTDHVLFIAAGAFHGTNPSDLIPELQGRFPIRVELSSLTADDFRRILTEPRTALVKQYQALLETEGVRLEFTEGGIKRLAEIAEEVNTRSENIGARRLHTVMMALLEDLLFEPPKDQKRCRLRRSWWINGWRISWRTMI